jgi:hypothetical protein
MKRVLGAVIVTAVIAAASFLFSRCDFLSAVKYQPVWRKACWEFCGYCDNYLSDLRRRSGHNPNLTEISFPPPSDKLPFNVVWPSGMSLRGSPKERMYSSYRWSSPEECENVASSDDSYLQYLGEHGDAKTQYLIWEERRKGCASSTECLSREPENFELLRKSAERGYDQAQFKLGVFEPDTQGAGMKWYRLAADQGHRKAQHFLAQIYLFGQGGSEIGQGANVDYEEAYFWYSVAGLNENDVPIVKEAKEKLSPAQLASVKKRVSQWKPVKTSPEGKYPSEIIPLNIAGLLCGGTSRKCQIVNHCGDVLLVACPYHVYYMANIKTKEARECSLRVGGCDGAVKQMSWTCGWPRGAATAADYWPN